MERMSRILLGGLTVIMTVLPPAIFFLSIYDGHGHPDLEILCIAGLALFLTVGVGLFNLFHGCPNNHHRGFYDLLRSKTFGNRERRGFFCQ